MENDVPEPESAQTATFLKTAGWPAFAFAMFVLGVVFGMAIQKERSQSMEQAMEEARKTVDAAKKQAEDLFECAKSATSSVGDGWK